MQISCIYSLELSQVLVSLVFSEIHHYIILTETMMSLKQNPQTAYVFALQWTIIQTKTLMSKKHLKLIFPF